MSVFTVPKWNLKSRRSHRSQPANKSWSRALKGFRFVSVVFVAAQLGLMPPAQKAIKTVI